MLIIIIITWLYVLMLINGILYLVADHAIKKKNEAYQVITDYNLLFSFINSYRPSYVVKKKPITKNIIIGI